ncbi:hypothetical protein CBR_g29552 [Chara braunii]|uniref:Aspartokinase n=1 Tax=Chara braunii TaxID=69332 RepID=A0A388LAQ5_CHABU|nr:hypothetical protein CBR_g29552 [Chara braunii]|eukprot:GBG79405.1 hypothetical protein CBR_g29552 [Chara braunii]
MKFLTDLHLKTAEELGVDRSLVTGLLEELQQLLTGIALMREMTPRTKDYLVSFGERMSTRLFAAYLNKNGVKACQGAKTGAITTLGRGGSDLTATAIGKALGLKEIQVWKDVDGVLTADPHLVSKKALPVPYLTFDEAAELAYFGAQVLHPQAMRPARDADIPVRVKNSYNPAASGTLIMRERDMSKNFVRLQNQWEEEGVPEPAFEPTDLCLAERPSQALLTSIVLKPHVTMLDIVSTRMLGQFGFLAKVFSIFEDMGISVDCVATSEVSVSLTLDPARMWTRELIQQELDRVVEQLRKIAFVKLSQKKSIISLIGNVERSSLILEKVFSVFRSCGINVQMISQGASKVNISVIVDDDEAELCVKALHCVFFEQEHLVERLIAGYGNGNLEPCC